ncbi:MAG: ABC transporter permease [Candidatus Odinarchaeum yellowstonii]|uniref:ABC transporter permease n=1 Tax=Odinarchaeota yellowstonii (strain LCB_4) TaxID=1841599 RepID=A0AAF0D1I6_ODILC|nr:MAG: ABC transporter permease [Candidatus Odinarchaeum yellowstonii]
MLKFKRLIADSILIAKKELLQLWRDKASLIFTFLIPVTIMAAFTFAIPKAQSQVNLQIGVYDADKTSLSTNIIGVLNNSNLEVKYTAESFENLKNMVELGKIAGAVVIPRGFTQALERLNFMNLTVIVDNSKRDVLNVLLSNIQKNSNQLIQVFKDYLKDAVVENITDIHRLLYDLRDNASTAALLVYGIPAVYISGNSSIGLDGWEQLYLNYKTQIEAGLITIYQINNFANESSYLYLQTILSSYPSEIREWALNYLQIFHYNWNATFVNAYPTESEVYSVLPRFRGESVLSLITLNYLNSTLSNSELNLFYNVYLNFSLSNWNNTALIDRFILQYATQNLSLSTSLIEDIYNLGVNPTEDGLNTVADNFLNNVFSNQVNQIGVNEEKIGGDIESGVATGIMVLGFALIFSCFDDIAGAMAREREKGTMPRLFLTPMNKLSFFLGKTISSITLTLMRATILLLMYLYLLGGVMVGSLLLFYLISIMIAILTISLGFVISARDISSRGVIILEIALMVPLIFFTGILMPKELMPPIAQIFQEYLPYWYTNDALRRVVLLGQGLEYIGFNLIVVAVSSLILFALAAVLTKRSI